MEETLADLSYLSIKYESLLSPVYYSKEECDGSLFFSDLFYAIQIASYVILLLSLLSSQGKIIGLELFGVLQLSFASMINNNSVNIYLYPLLEYKSFNGYNLMAEE